MAPTRSLALEVVGVSVPDAVSTIITRNHVLYEALKLKIVNYHALASKISAEVEELTSRRPKLETIVVAIKRFADGLKEEEMNEAAAILKDSKISLTGGIVDMTITSVGLKTHEILEHMIKVTSNLAGAPSIFQLPSSVKVIAEQDDAEMIARQLSKRYSVARRGSMAKLTIRISPKAEKVPGIASFITELLYRNGISIADAFLGYEDIVIIVDDKLGPRVYELLSEETRRVT